MLVYGEMASFIWLCKPLMSLLYLSCTGTASGLVPCNIWNNW